MSTITVRELREQLSELNDNLPVYLQTDPEGNGYHSVGGVEAGMTDLEQHRPDDIHSPRAEEFPEEYGLEPGEYKTNCVVIYP